MPLKAARAILAIILVTGQRSISGAHSGPTALTRGLRIVAPMHDVDQQLAIRYKGSEEHYDKPCTEGIANGGGPDSCGGLRPAQAREPDDRYGHHQG